MKANLSSTELRSIRNLLLKQRGSGIFGNMKEALSNLIDKGRSFFFPSNSVNAGTKKLLEKYQNWKIMGATIQRKPVFASIDYVLNIISLGSFGRAKQKMGYDDMFHLSIVFDLESPDDRNKSQKLKLEKNEKVTLSEGAGFTSETEALSIKLNDEITLGALWEKMIKQMTEFYFFQYHAWENNCQVFILSCIKALDSNTSDVEKFIKQDALEIAKQMPRYVGKISQFTTDLGAKLSEIWSSLTGKGKYHKKRKHHKRHKKTYKCHC
jgi:hypothetical protein